MEVFAISHEYSHHCLMHGVATSSEETDLSFQLEHDADLLARMISGAIGKDDSGAGAALMLGAIELVTQTQSVLVSGSDRIEPSKTHPPVPERINSGSHRQRACER
jgi:hypothetical protein